MAVPWPAWRRDRDEARADDDADRVWAIRCDGDPPLAAPQVMTAS
jgi:hypothetical protein